MTIDRVAIIGGAGFIGSELSRKLLAKGSEILVYDNFSTGKKSNLPHAHHNLIIKKGDIKDHQMLHDCLSNFRPTVVYHLAALHYIPYCDEHAMETLWVNVECTEAVLEVCGEIEPQMLILGSSAAVYKISDKANIETDIPNPYDIYGYSKYFGEKLALKFFCNTNIPTIVARIFNTYGPYETNPHVIPRIIGQMNNGNSQITLGDVTPKRDFVFVEDMAEALIELAKTTPNGFNIFNIGTGTECSIKEIMDEIAKLLNKSIIIDYDPNLKRKIDRMHLLADASKIEKDVGWKSRFSMEEGLKRTLDFYLCA